MFRQHHRVLFLGGVKARFESSLPGGGRRRFPTIQETLQLPCRAEVGAQRRRRRRARKLWESIYFLVAAPLILGVGKVIVP